MKFIKFTSNRIYIALITILLIFSVQPLIAQQLTSSFTEYKGKVVDAKSSDEIASTHLHIKNSTISTITNSEGEFSLKVPSSNSNSVVTISVLGYQSKNIHLNYFELPYTIISLEPAAEELSEVQLFSATNAKELVRQTLANKGTNYINEPLVLTAFYRENIQQRNHHVSLAEAVVKINKQPYHSGKKDKLSLYKARKSSEYNSLDTLAFKLRGGPYTPLFTDIMKYPEFLFFKNSIEGYQFDFESPTQLGNKYLYVVKFKELNHAQPWYYGKLYIDAKTLTLVKADYSLNVDDRKSAMNMFVKKKPGGSKVFPIETAYQIDYNESDGKWYYSYGNAYMKFVVNWKNKLFNSRYTLTSEMIVTNRAPYSKNWTVNAEEIKPSIVMIDDVSGFSDENFWGQNNIIEPNKSILNAIEKIKDKIQ
ncbi:MULTISPECIES: carboxypeptidase-like regulatory domain-containing protein [Mesonia]|uniref:Uncharacterized protein n=1 Tax=Mesonia oceanica TaxID=2687242 RepID=A0AC61YD02_9FLAO|nr:MULTISPECIES: carboxypeptidase-like regulatory domain-containing protein [Mesonia]MAN26460.1 hypothetical protein [Mesonia sp.]MAQ41562.1 hypothetical protein [Mesonia sp.]MBJ96352.1 hypothetical protein [Flavobacteriaceae bacterium]VVV02259.1 hypothetical protein FVB9532_03557 [Mesonia oceanica]|tara:strand:+ start:3205 stop:4470 length:1266 start_codon:yes stop_codon:yes gene_type:complete